MTRAASKPDRLPETFDALNALRPLRPIQDQADLENVREVVDALAVLPARNKDQEDYLETLSTLIEKYESELNDDETSDLSPLEVLRYLMEGHDMSASDLGRLLGNRELGAAILRGDRQLSKTHIQLLSQRFAVSTDLFLSPLRSGEIGTGGNRTQNVTAKDLAAGIIRIPQATKRLLPDQRTDLSVTLRGSHLQLRYDPRNGPDRNRSGVLRVGKHRLNDLVSEGDVFTVIVQPTGAVILE
jgi:antitoxin component HigA of HigAB toxin-antitoxin module